MDRKTLAILLIVATVLLCACPGLAALCMSPAIFSGSPGNFVIDGQPQPQVPMLLGLGLFCVGLLGLLIPIGLAYIMLRKPRRSPAPVDLDESLPPPI